MPDTQAKKPSSLMRVLLVTLAIALAFGGGFYCALYIGGIDTLLSSTETPPSDGTRDKAAPAQPKTDQDKLPAGRWQFFRDDITDARLREEHKQLTEEILSMGYMAGSMPAPTETAVTVYDPANSYEACSVYSTGHAPEAYLIDMTGKILHTWGRDFADVWPDRDTNWMRGDMYWRRFYLYPNGDLLAIYEGLGLVKLDKDSNVIWSFPGLAHHDLEVTEDGTIYVLTREDNDLPRINASQAVQEDFITTLDADGNELSKISLLECFENSPHRLLLERMADYGDLFHTNTLELLDGSLSHRSPAFAKGNFLICLWKLDAIAVVDPAKEQVVWSLCGMWRKQHQPTVLENGNLLIFDNLGYYERSQVMEFDPFSQEIAWIYRGDPPDQFLSFTCGSCQRLPNGNTLITESDNGRAFEVTPDKEIVWQYVNPHRAGDNNEFIATLFEMVRLDPNFPLDWLKDDAPTAEAKTN